MCTESTCIPILPLHVPLTFWVCFPFRRKAKSRRKMNLPMEEKLKYERKHEIDRELQAAPHPISIHFVFPDTAPAFTGAFSTLS